jgi:AmmeMemoRadiSam system protein A
MGFDVLGIVAPHPPIMVPEVGHDEATATADSAAAMRAAATLLDRFAPETVVIMSPHTAGYRDAVTVSAGDGSWGDLAQFGAPDVSYAPAGDPELSVAILSAAASAGVTAVASEPGRRAEDSTLDHGVLVPMYFLDRDARYPLVDLSLSFLTYEKHRALGRAVRTAALETGRRVAFVASGDCSHRLKPGAPAGFAPDAHIFDERLVDLLSAGDFEGLSRIDPRLIEEAGECGLRSFVTLGGFLEGSAAAPRVLAYESPWGVGYLTAVFAPVSVLDEALGASDSPRRAPRREPRTPDRGRKGGLKGRVESDIVRLARETIERHVRGEASPALPRLAGTGLPERAGAFVSLHENGELRGCIGTISPTRDSLAEEIVRNAVQAATADPRFPPVEESELDALEVKVDVLHAAEPAAGLDDLDPRTYGVIVTSGWRRGLLLPDLEGVDTAEQQVAIAMRKGGIAPGETVVLERFKVDRYA